MQLSVNDAKTIAGFLSMAVIPFAVTWLKQVTWADWQKFLLAAVLSAVAGFFTAYTGGQLLLSGSIVQNAAVIFAAAQIVYYGAFRGLGLERALFPKSALAHQAGEQAVQQVSSVSTEDARDVLDSKSNTTLDVTATVTP